MKGAAARTSEPPGGSTKMTSAPSSAKSLPQYWLIGPASSRTRMPASACGGATVSCVMVEGICEKPVDRLRRGIIAAGNIPGASSALSPPPLFSNDAMNFKLDDDQTILQNEAQKLAREVFKDRAARWDQNAEVPWENIKLLAEQGYLGLLVPEQYGGSGGTIMDLVLVLEQFG